MPGTTRSPAEYFSDGLIRGFWTFFVFAGALAFLTFGLLGVVGMTLGYGFSYLIISRIGDKWLDSTDVTIGARPKHWLFGFGIAILVQVALILLFISEADDGWYWDGFTRPLPAVQVV